MSNACKIFSCLDLNLVCDIMFICDNVRLVFFSLECGSFIINSQYLRCHMLKYRWNITNFRKIEINSTISFLYICAAAVIKHCRWFICNWRKEIVQLNQHAQRAKAINKCSLTHNVKPHKNIVKSRGNIVGSMSRIGTQKVWQLLNALVKKGCTFLLNSVATTRVLQ